MIALDGSALFAVILDEPRSERCDAALRGAGSSLMMSAPSLTETLIVATGKDLSAVRCCPLETISRRPTSFLQWRREPRAIGELSTGSAITPPRALPLTRASVVAVAGAR